MLKILRIARHLETAWLKPERPHVEDEVTSLTFAQLVDIDQIRKLLEAHYKFTGVGAAILDAEENILVAVALHDICSRFHRSHPVAESHCRESDAFIKAHLYDCCDGYMDYRCKNGLVDVAMPIIINGSHLATFFTGQFFYEDDKPSEEYFLSQADKFGFDASEYLEAMRRVPVYSRDHVRNIIDYFRNLVEIITGMGLKNLELGREMTERKNSERRLALLNFALDQVQEAAYLVDEHGRFLYVNGESCRVLGYGQDDFPDMSVDDIDPDHQMRAWSEHWLDIRTNGPLTFVTRHKTKNGRIFPVELSASIFQYEGQDYALALARDITDRKHAEDSLRLTQFCIDNASLSIHRVAPDGRIVSANEYMCHTLGYTREELTNLSIFDIDPNFSRETWPDHRNMIRATGTGTFETLHRRKNGTKFPVEVTVNYLSFGENEVSISFAKDITDRKRLQEKLLLAHNELEKRVAERTVQLEKTAEALGKSEERYALAVQGANDGIWDLNLLTGEAYYSSRWKSILGYEESEISGDFQEWESRIHPDDLRGAMEAAKTCGEGRTPTFHAEYRMRHKNGSYRWVLTRGAFLRDSRGQAYRMAGSLSDVTERKELESQLLHAQKMESIGMLAGGVAHEFNNLLMAISGYGQLLQESIPEEDECAQESITNLMNAAERAAELTRGLLAFSRKQIIRTILVDIDKLIGNTGKIIQRVIGEGIRFSTGLSCENLRVKADPGQIEQVLMNLATNARDAMPDGGSLSIGTRLVDIKAGKETRYDLPAPGKFVRISVDDTGTGIDRKTLGKIFEPFYTTKDIGKGTGLGLSIVHGIIKQHNGSILVGSEPGKGTTFDIYLPLAEDRPDT